jgi:flagellar hook protein FlgE
MIRSMFTAVNSLNLYQSFMDVIADNLANANTTGFKSSRVTFMDQVAQLVSVGASPTANLGGINPAQVGLGSRLGAISQSFTQGVLQSTNRYTDLSIQGDGFFVYRNGSNNYYSRDGSLSVDQQGFLVNGNNGMRIQGWQATAGSAGMVVNTGGPVGDIQIPIGSTIARATQNAIMTGNLNSAAASGSAGALTTTMGVYDTQGALHNVSVTFTPNGSGSWGWTVNSGGSGSGTITFDVNGNVSGGGIGAVTVAGINGLPNFTVNMDMSKVTQLAMQSAVGVSSQDGVSAGSLVGFSVVSDSGNVMAVYSNGMQELVGRVALANFVNPDGLVRYGQNMWQVGLNSGDPMVGEPNTGGRGMIASGYLEGSNVDMAKEFTNMILAQRGFQAQSRIITTSDEMLTELVNLKR